MNWCARCGEPLVGPSCARCRVAGYPALQQPGTPSLEDLLEVRRPGATPVPEVAVPGRLADARRRQRASRGVVSGVVNVNPRVVPTMFDPEPVLRSSMWLLLALVVLTSPALLSALMVWLVLLGIGLWLLGRIGLLGVFLFAAGRGRRDRRRQDVPTMAFRVLAGEQQRSVRLVGHDDGVEVGDEVTVHGVAWAGSVRASSVVNHTTGAVLRRSGRLRTGVLVCLNVALALTVISQVAA